MFTIKSLFIGPPEVGKTSIIKKFCLGTFSDSYLPTVGLNFLSKDAHSRESYFAGGLRHQIWDSVFFEFNVRVANQSLSH